MLILAMALSCWAADEPLPTPGGLDADHWSTRHGLPQNTVHDLAIGEQGRLWIATLGGITRFDGRTFEAWRPEGLAATRFRGLAFVGGQTWVVSEDGGVFVGDTERVQSVLDVPTYDLHVDPDGTVFTASQDGIRRWVDGTPERIEDTAGHAVARCGDGPLVFAPREGSVRSLDGELPGQPPRWSAWRLWCGPDDSLRIGTSRGTLVQTETGFDEVPGVTLLDWGGARWVHDGRTLREVDGERRLDLAGMLDDARIGVSSTLVDPEGGLWLGLDVSGLARVRRNRGKLLPGLPVTHSVTTDAEDRVWMASCQDGVVVEGVVEDEVRAAVEALECPAVWSDGEGGVFVQGGDEDGRRVLHVRDGDVQTRLEGLLRPERLQSPTTGPWMVRGQVIWSLEGTGRPLVAAADLGATNVQVLRAAADALEPWVSLDDGARVARLDGSGRAVRTIPLPGRMHVRDVQELDGDRLLVGTYGDGLYVVEGEEVVAHLEPRHGLCDASISHVFDIGDGRVWVNTNLGVGHLDRQALQELDGTEPVACSLVTSSEGNGTSGAVLPGGRLVVPTVHGTLVVDTTGIVAPRPPSIALTAAHWDDHDLLHDGAVVDGPGTLSLAWSGVHFDAPGTVRYRYRLRGRDEDWSEVVQAERLVVSNLGPGQYTFEVQARAGGGVWSPAASIPLDRRSALWERQEVWVTAPIGGLFAVLLVLAIALWISRKANDRLREEVDQRVRAEGALRAQQEHSARMQQALEAHRRFESLGRLADGVAHDVNNLLAVVSAHGSSLLERDEEELTEAGRALLSTSERGATLTRQLLSFGRRRSEKAVDVDVAGAVRQLAPMLRRLIREDIELTVDAPGSVTTCIDPGLFDQLVTHLVVSARDAIPGEGRIALTLRATRADGREWVDLECEDDGRRVVGDFSAATSEFSMASEVRGPGSALGLSHLGAAAREADAEVILVRSDSESTVVRVRLRQVQTSTETPMKAPQRARALPTNLSVLIVDDDVRVLRAVNRLVRRQGWVTHQATDLTEAVALARQHELDLLLTDLVLVGPSGLEVRDALWEIDPDMAVVIMTGHAGDLVGSLTDVVVLPKPFDGDALVRAVRTALAVAGRL